MRDKTLCGSQVNKDWKFSVKDATKAWRGGVCNEKALNLFNLKNSIPLVRPPTKTLVDKDNTGLADTGATGIFLKENAPKTNVRPVDNLIIGGTVGGRHFSNTYDCGIIVTKTLDATARKAHILPGLATGSLIGISPLVDAGCTVIFDNEVVHDIKNKQPFGKDGKIQLTYCGASLSNHSKKKLTMPTNRSQSAKFCHFSMTQHTSPSNQHG